MSLCQHDPGVAQIMRAAPLFRKRYLCLIRRDVTLCAKPPSRPAISDLEITLWNLDLMPLG